MRDARKSAHSFFKLGVEVLGHLYDFGSSVRPDVTDTVRSIDEQFTYGVDVDVQFVLGLSRSDLAVYDGVLCLRCIYPGHHLLHGVTCSVGEVEYATVTVVVQNFMSGTVGALKLNGTYQ